jgi:hypothetical protein
LVEDFRQLLIDPNGPGGEEAAELRLKALSPALVSQGKASVDGPPADGGRPIEVNDVRAGILWDQITHRERQITNCAALRIPS